VKFRGVTFALIQIGETGKDRRVMGRITASRFITISITIRYGTFDEANTTTLSIGG
jgi:hypothetical protein